MARIYHNRTWYGKICRVDKPLKDTLCYAAPFAAWLALQSFLPATAGAYAVRTVVTAAVALACAWAARSTFPAGRISAARRDPGARCVRAVDFSRTLGLVPHLALLAPRHAAGNTDPFAV